MDNPLRHLLAGLPDRRELTFGDLIPPSDSRIDGLRLAWRESAAMAFLAYRAWCENPGRNAYTAYRAAQDRADAAQDSLARPA